MTEIAERTGLNKSTVFRLLATLESKGFVKRDPDTEKYQLGFRIWELSAHLNRSKDPAVLFLPEMERLRDELDETVSLYVYDGIERIRIQAVESNQAIRRVAPVGVGCRLPSELPVKFWSHLRSRRCCKSAGRIRMAGPCGKV